jgi:hypothetical protein
VPATDLRQRPERGLYAERRDRRDQAGARQEFHLRGEGGRDRDDAAERHEREEQHHEPRQQRDAPSGFPGPRDAQRQHDDDQDDGEHRDPEQLDDGGKLPRAVRDREPGAHDLRDVVDRGADQKPLLEIVETERAEQHGIDDHRDGRERRHRHHGEQRVPLGLVVWRNDGRDGKGRGGPADRDRATRENGEAPLPPEKRRRDEAGRDGQRDQRHHRRRPGDPHLRQILDRDADAEQPHAQPKDELRGELHPLATGRFRVQEVERHAEKQGEQHHGRPVMRPEKARGGSDRQAQEKARHQRSNRRAHAGSEQHLVLRDGSMAQERSCAIGVDE